MATARKHCQIYLLSANCMHILWHRKVVFIVRCKIYWVIAIGTHVGVCKLMFPIIAHHSNCHMVLTVDVCANITLECPEAPTAAWGPLWGQSLAQQGATLMTQATQWDTSSNEPSRAVSQSVLLDADCELTSHSHYSRWAIWAGPGAGHPTERAGAWDSGSISPPDRRKATFLRPTASGRFQGNDMAWQQQFCGISSSI